MCEAGYQRLNKIDGEEVSHQVQYTRRTYGGVQCEYDVHWELVNPQAFANLVSFDAIEAQSMAVPRLVEHARAPSYLHSLFVACIHRAAHHYGSDDLIWLYDIHLLIERLSTDEWNAFAELAMRTRTRRVCLSGLQGATVFGGTVPDRIRAMLSEGDDEASAVFVEASIRMIDVELSNLRMLPSWRRRVAFVRQHLFPRASYMLGAYRVHHRAWLPVLYAHRLVRGAVRWVRVLRPPIE